MERQCQRRTTLRFLIVTFLVAAVSLGYAGYRYEENQYRMPNVERAFADDGNSEDIAHIKEVLAGGEEESAYSHNEVQIKQFDGVRVTGDTAYVLVQGAQKYTMLNGSYTEDLLSQYRLHLHRSNDTQYGWLISKSASSFVDVSGY